jgi:hypothetical protein
MIQYQSFCIQEFLCKPVLASKYISLSIKFSTVLVRKSVP